MPCCGMKTNTESRLHLLNFLHGWLNVVNVYTYNVYFLLILAIMHTFKLHWSIESEGWVVLLCQIDSRSDLSNKLNLFQLYLVLFLAHFLLLFSVSLSYFNDSWLRVNTTTYIYWPQNRQHLLSIHIHHITSILIRPINSLRTFYTYRFVTRTEQNYRHIHPHTSNRNNRSHFVKSSR